MFDWDEVCQTRASYKSQENWKQIFWYQIFSLSDIFLSGILRDSIEIHTIKRNDGNLGQTMREKKDNVEHMDSILLIIISEDIDLQCDVNHNSK